MSRESKEDRLKTQGYLLGISVGLYDAMRFLNERSGECFKRRDDKEAGLYRAASNEIGKLGDEARARYDKEYPK